MTGSSFSGRTYEQELIEARALRAQYASRRSALEAELTTRSSKGSGTSTRAACPDQDRLIADAVRKTLRILRIEDRRLAREIAALRMLLTVC